MNSEILNYLSEIDKKETTQFFENIRSKKLKIKFKVEGFDKIESAQIYATTSPDRFGVVVRKDFEPGEQNITFKIHIGTELYFFKTIIQVEKKSYFMQAPFTVFKLIRRKNTRYVIPENWAQVGYIVSAGKKVLNSKMRLLELSNSGIRVHVMTELPRYEKQQKIKLQFKLHRRSEVFVEALVKHVKQNSTGGQLLGVEFLDVSPLMRSKIENLCEDLLHSLA